MLPNLTMILIIILLGIGLSILSSVLPKKTSTVLELTIVLGVAIYLFVAFSFGEAMFLISLGAAAFAEFASIFDRGKFTKQKELNQLLREVESIEIEQTVEKKRIFIDLVISLFVSLGAILFLVFAKESYAVIKLFIGFMLLTVFAQSITRLGNYITTKLYWIPEEERFIIISKFQSRDYPLRDLKEMSIESSPDLLKLHPLFSFLSSNLDFTKSFQKVLKLSFPGETLYITPMEGEQWSKKFRAFVKASNKVGENEVLPLWHPSNLKRLFWKGYFAITVKGISGYTGLLLLLIWLDTPSWGIITAIVIWWILNLYVSDRVLLAGTDAKPVLEGELYERAKQIFLKAGIPNTGLFITDSPIYNGLATGMNIGRGSIILTTATLQLHSDSVDAILAHEAAHVKKRDVLTTQLARIVYIGLLVAAVFYLFDELKWLVENHTILLFILVYVLMFVFPLYLSFVSQWTEVRADYIGASLLPGGRNQMAQGLKDLTTNQEKDIDKSFEYQFSSKNTPAKKFTSLERDSWGWRFLEFQFLPHPPMYWRIASLISHKDWINVRNNWLRDRWKESVPDKFRKKAPLIK